MRRVLIAAVLVGCSGSSFSGSGGDAGGGNPRVRVGLPGNGVPDAGPSVARAAPEAGLDVAAPGTGGAVASGGAAGVAGFSGTGAGAGAAGSGGARGGSGGALFEDARGPRPEPDATSERPSAEQDAAPPSNGPDGRPDAAVPGHCERHSDCAALDCGDTAPCCNVWTNVCGCDPGYMTCDPPI
ncbi:MAG: hypothetical protein GWN84_05330 [Gammaproteobacteria bacterium]|nr:hypothetical protein [Gammaproteobacteria bacterium]NIR82384.1 hypothetical protein [Gammaproteobacteria bacterium]NIU03529.1 hypothetical protein [Gammaproteobacteria bacterium]NIX84803.1 hypothetical protein [Gammaproteobacteria bacterium]